MPSRSSRNNARNAKYNDQQRSQSREATPISPPATLPELEADQISPIIDHPMPEILDNAAGVEAAPRLIDFDTYTPPPAPLLSLDNDNDRNDDYDDNLDDYAYRSPPFREAHLPDDVEESPPPLPVLPRSAATLPSDDEYEEEQPSYRDPSSRTSTLSPPPTVAPTFSHSRSHSSSGSAPSSGRLDTLSRTIRGYVPSLPSAGPSPPAVSRPVSFGRFSNANATGSGYPQSSQTFNSHRRTQSHTQDFTPQEYERDYERYADEEGQEYYGYGGGYGSPPAPAYGREQHLSPGYGYRQGQEPYQPRPTIMASGYSPPTSPSQPQPTATMGIDRLSPSQDQQHASGSGLAQAMRRTTTRGGQEPSRTSRSESRTRRGLSDQETVDQEDVITLAKWDTLPGDRRSLILCNGTGFGAEAKTSTIEIWDCTDLNKIEQVLSVRGTDLGQEQGERGVGRVVQAAILPPPSRRVRAVSEGDAFEEDRPLLGLLLESIGDDDDTGPMHQKTKSYQTKFVLYSLRVHQVVKRLVLPGLPVTFEVNEHFIAISTTSPPAIHVLASANLETLYVVPSSSLELHTPPPIVLSTPTGPSSSSPYGHGHTSSTSISGSIATSAQSTAISVANAISATAQSHLGLTRPISGAASSSAGVGTEGSIQTRPQPVFSLSNRLLAYASPSSASSSSLASPTAVTKGGRRLSSSSSTSGPSPSLGPSSVSSSPFSISSKLGNINLNVTQADVGNAAIKVGEGLFSGMKFLGGIALEAAKSRVGSTGPSPTSGLGPRSSSSSPGGRFVSRSAPDNVTDLDEDAARKFREQRRLSGAFTYTGAPTSGQHSTTTVAPSAAKAAFDSGYSVTVVDLGSLLSISGRPGSQLQVKAKDKKSLTQPIAINAPKPVFVDEFVASKRRPVAGLHFAKDGTSVGVVLSNGHEMKVFKIRPVPGTFVASVGALNSSTSADSSAGGDPEIRRGTSTQIYDLRRGRTSAVVECVDWTEDGRWTGFATRHRTVHVFAVNPYGGKIDVRSHMEGRVRNVDAVDQGIVSLLPIRKLRGLKSTEQPKAPIAFTFVPISSLSKPASSSSPSLLPPLSPATATHSPTLSPSRGKRGTNYQHVLHFDSEDGILSLRRLTLEKHMPQQGLGGGSFGVSSISLPGMGGAGRLSSSPSANNPISASKDKDKVGDHLMELGAKETTVATWKLRRDTAWTENKTSVEPGTVRTGATRQSSLGGDWISEAELSTFSVSQKVLPRSLYLSHQFSFRTLGEDYHALIRSYQLDIAGGKIDVRKEVEISAYSSGGDNSSFVEGFSAPRDIRRASSSFDEPIASAISGSFDSSNIPAILPMYPNGISGSKPKSFRNSIPIRTMAGIGDGVTEGIGRVRRGMHKVRSPQLVARSDSSMSGTVPLEFDEEDEDFLIRDTLDIPPGRQGETSTSRGTSRDGASAESARSASSIATTPATTGNSSTHQLMEADVVGTVDEEMFDGGWDRQDKQAIEEAEQFDDLTAAAYLAEEQERQQQQVAMSVPLAATPGPKRKARKRGN